MAPPRRRLDAELVRRGLAASRTEAQEAIRAGLVTVDGAPVGKAASQVHAGQAVVVSAPPRAYVSRGGLKLAHGLDRFRIDPTGRRALDAGVSTGGFTDCLRQRGAGSVIAYDVGYGQVHDKIRRDPAVEVHERTNVRDLTPEDVPGPAPDLLVADLSFIALRTVLPTLRPLLAPSAEAVVLVKPQFEAVKGEVGKGGVVRDPDVWARVLTEVAAAAARIGWVGFDATASPLLGPAGNVEFLAHLTVAPATPTSEVDQRVQRAVDEGRHHRATGREADT
ncbi:MAG: TlyA family RNA methyltransferase [Nitriliruptor sp.]|uniref:TlyA family RNA methyltransferase n=1 Tax=Nitriliruptor sp. TaxID=2448056 RepID=UPI0034A09862